MYVGPVFDDEPHSADARSLEFGLRLGVPLVVVSMSTSYQHQEAALALVLGALATLPVRVLVTLGHHLRVEDVAAPGERARSVRWMPHRQVFPDAALVVTHAGLGTVLAALACGAPLLCLPRDASSR